MKILIPTTFLRKSLNCTRLDLFDNPTLAYENGDEIVIFIYKSGGLSNRSNIYDLSEAGYSLRAISRKLRCSRNTVTKYLSGDMENICTTTLSSGVDRYRDYIMKSLADGVCRRYTSRHEIAGTQVRKYCCL